MVYIYKCNYLLKNTVLKYLFFVVFVAQAQFNRPSKQAPHTIGTSGNHDVMGGNTYSWTVGEAVIFTASTSSQSLTQGFHQPMICKNMPIITAFNQSSCTLPYTLTTTSNFHVYRWYRETTYIASENTSTYLPVRNGNYTVLVGDSTGCMLVSSVMGVDFSLKNIIPNITVSGVSVAEDTLIGTTPFASYQWYVIASDGVHRAIVGATQQIYRPFFRATYYVKINTTDQCVSYSVPYSVQNPSFQPLNRYVFNQNDDTIDLKSYREIVEFSMSVYPIPTKSDYTVELESPQQNTVILTLYNAAGQIVQSKSIENKYGKLLLNYKREDLASGKYILSVKDGDKKHTQNLLFE